jgi:hypothetical protein
MPWSRFCGDRSERRVFSFRFKVRLWNSALASEIAHFDLMSRRDLFAMIPDTFVSNSFFVATLALQKEHSDMISVTIGQAQNPSDGIIYVFFIKSIIVDGSEPVSDRPFSSDLNRFF